MARIDVMTDRPVGVVDPRLFGGVLDETSPWSGPGGIRADLLAAVRDLGVTSVRWAAGVDPDQFMAWCSTAGAEPVLRLDLGTDTLDEALAWARDGVRYWALGQDLPDGADPELYVARARGWAKALRMAEPGISLISYGHTGMDDWDRVVIDGLARYVDFHGVHLFTGSADYWTNVLAPHYAERALSVAGALIDRARYVQRIEREISVAYDAWNVSLGGGRLEERYNLADALAVATYLNVFVRPDAVGVQSAKREVDGEYVDVTFSPHSFTLLEMHLA